MDINLTLFVQVIVFITLIVIIMRYAWPKLDEALEERRNTIAKGLEDAELSHRKLIDAQDESEKIHVKAKEKAAKLIEEARLEANSMIDQARKKAKEEQVRILAQAEEDIEIISGQARQELTNEIGTLAVSVAERLIGQQLTPKIDNQIIQQAIAQVSEKK